MLRRQYTDLLRDHNDSGVALNSPGLKQIEETLSLEERDVLEAQAGGRVRTFLQQSPMFILFLDTDTEKVTLNLQEYLVE